VDAGVIEALVGIVVTILVGVVTPTLFQMVWGRPRLRPEFSRHEDESTQLSVILYNPPVDHPWLRWIGVVRTPNGLQASYRILNMLDHAVDSGNLWLRLNHGQPEASVSLPDHGWAWAPCVTHDPGHSPVAIIGGGPRDHDTIGLDIGDYYFDVKLKTSTGIRNISSRFRVHQNSIAWVPEPDGPERKRPLFGIGSKVL
jgi:hypothetical protein